MTIRVPPSAWTEDLLESSFQISHCVWAPDVPCSLRAGWGDSGHSVLLLGFWGMGRAWFWGGHTGWVGARAEPVWP